MKIKLEKHKGNMYFECMCMFTGEQKRLSAIRSFESEMPKRNER